MDNRQLLLRGLPKIDELLLDEQLVFFMESTPRSVVVDACLLYTSPSPRDRG